MCKGRASNGRVFIPSFPTPPYPFQSQVYVSYFASSTLHTLHKSSLNNSFGA